MPSFLIFAGAKLIVIFLGGSCRFRHWNTAKTRSFASKTDLSGNPITIKRGIAESQIIHSTYTSVGVKPFKAIVWTNAIILF